MSDVFRDREQGYEAKFAHDEELRFRIRARRDRLFARWAAGELGLAEAATEEVVKAVLAIKDGPGHERALKDHVGQLLRGRPQGAEDNLTAALDRCMREARAQLGGEVI
ncbi:MAG: ATPase inhibitor subunit zeta [Rhodopila sp.]